MRRGDIDGDRHVAPGLETAGEHGVHDDVERLLVASEPRPIAPLVADQGRLEAPLLQYRADGAIHRNDHLQGFAITFRADRDDQHVLDVEVAAGVETARNHIDHGKRQGWLERERTFFPANRVDRARSCSNERTVLRRVRLPPRGPRPAKRRAGHSPRAGPCSAYRRARSAWRRGRIDRPDPYPGRPERFRGSRCQLPCVTLSPP